MLTEIFAGQGARIIPMKDWLTISATTKHF